MIEDIREYTHSSPDADPRMHAAGYRFTARLDSRLVSISTGKRPGHFPKKAFVRLVLLLIPAVVLGSNHGG